MQHTRVKHSGPLPQYSRRTMVEGCWVVAGTQALDGCWRHLKKGMNHARRTDDCFEHHVRFAQWQYWDKFLALADAAATVDLWAPLE
eukprot:5485688-Amphidinium_carterae.1